MPMQHRCDVIGLSGNAQADLPQVCKRLDELSLEGWELVNMLLLGIDQPTMRDRVLITQKQPAFALFLRKPAPTSPLEIPEAT